MPDQTITETLRPLTSMTELEFLTFFTQGTGGVITKHVIEDLTFYAELRYNIFLFGDKNTYKNLEAAGFDVTFSLDNY